MNEKLKEMLEARLAVKFCSLDHVQVFPKDLTPWFYGESLDVVYDMAIEYGRATVQRMRPAPEQLLSGV